MNAVELGVLKRSLTGFVLGVVDYPYLMDYGRFARHSGRISKLSGATSLDLGC
jgi:hypothetical protein